MTSLGGYSNAWYTTIDRDPFAWAYKTASGDMVGSQTPNPALGEFIVGPRWRLLNTKFGQNIPHTDMPKPLVEDPNNPACIPPPYEKSEVKYETGDVLDEPTTINLLDWKTTAEAHRWGRPRIATGLHLRLDNHVGAGRGHHPRTGRHRR